VPAGLTLSSLSAAELRQRLAETGVYLRTGPLVVHLRSSLPTVAEGIHLLYGDYPLLESEFADFHVKLARPRNWRHWLKPQVEFSFDGYHPFKPLPLSQAFPMFEWALNWCVANHIHRYLNIHAAVIEKNGYAVILPGPPGAGKSTLCAALVNRGWRLLSDEMALLSLEQNLVIPIPRPVSLKNQSIDIIRHYAPETVFGRLAVDTHKGVVAHMKPSLDSVQRATIPAKPAWVILPRYEAGAEAVLSPLPKGQICMRLAENSFNYNILSGHAFKTLTTMLDQCHCYSFKYSQLDDALQIFNALEPTQ
jgi:hypothetical protein